MPIHVYQNERYYGLAWRPPALLERPGWSDEAGNAVDLKEAPAEESGAWCTDVNTSTDAEGWLYASVFKHLDYPRPGGRAGRRAGDFVRRRKWVRTKEDEQPHGIVNAAEQAAEAAAKAIISPVAQMQGHRFRKQTEIDRRKSALKMFLGMLASTIKRRQLWSVMPMDPGAWYVLLTKHQSDLLARQAAALASAPSALEQGAIQADRPQNLIRDLVCAAVHSRAAYGHAMAAGHLASLFNFALLATLHQFHFDPVGGASGQANNDAVAALAGIPLEDLKLAEWHNSIMRPCHYLAVDRANHCIVLSIRGSLETGDILSDLTAKPLEIFGMLDTEGLVHEGMMSAATYVQCNTAAALHELSESHQGWPLLITGHSMGGSVATILAVLMRKGGAPRGLGPIRCIAIGPAPVFSRPLAAACNEFVTSVVLGCALLLSPRDEAPTVEWWDFFFRSAILTLSHLGGHARADVVPRISYASVESLFLEFANSSPIGNLGRKITQTLEGIKVEWPSALKAPTFRPSALPRLQSIVNLTDNETATAKAVQAAETAAAALKNPEEQDADGSAIEMTRQRRRDSSGGASPGGQWSAVEATNAAYSLSKGFTKVDADSAARKLSILKARSVEQPRVGKQPSQEGKDSEDASREGSKAEKVGEGARASEDHRTAAEVLNTGGGEFRDQAGNPEPLFVAGRVLWLIPLREQQTAAPDKRDATSEVQMTQPGKDGSAAEELEALHQEDKNWMERWQTAFEESFSKVAAEASVQVDNSGRTRASAKKRPASAVIRGTFLPAAQSQSREFPSLAVEEVSAPAGGRLETTMARQLPKRARSGDNKAADKALQGTQPCVDGYGDHRAEGAAKPVPKVLSVERDQFEQILLTTEMMPDHLPDSYLSAINQL